MQCAGKQSYYQKTHATLIDSTGILVGCHEKSPSSWIEVASYVIEIRKHLSSHPYCSLLQQYTCQVMFYRANKTVVYLCRIWGFVYMILCLGQDNDLPSYNDMADYLLLFSTKYIYRHISQQLPCNKHMHQFVNCDEKIRFLQSEAKKAWVIDHLKMCKLKNTVLIFGLLISCHNFVSIIFCSPITFFCHSRHHHSHHPLQTKTKGIVMIKSKSNNKS